MNQSSGLQTTPEVAESGVIVPDLKSKRLMVCRGVSPPAGDGESGTEQQAFVTQDALADAPALTRLSPVHILVDALSNSCRQCLSLLSMLTQLELQ